MQQSTGLPESEVLKLGYTIDEFKNLGNFPDTIEEFREHPLQMVNTVSKVRGEFFLEGRRVVVKKGSNLVMPLNDFMKIYNASHGNVIMGSSLLKDNLKLYNGENLDNKKLLVWTFGLGWGDILFVQAILRHLKNRYPTCKIKWALPQKYHTFVKNFDMIDSVVPTPFESKHIMRHSYHMHFDALVSGFSQGKTKNCYDLMAEFIGLDIPKEELNPKIPIPISNMKYIKKEIRKLELDTKPFIVIHLKTSTPRRNPSMEFKNNIIDALITDYNIVFIDSADQKNEINKLINGRSNCYNLCEVSRNMTDVLAILNLARIVVSVDTSIIHMATAVGTPTYGLYGPFNGELRVSTYNNCKWVNGTCDISPCLVHSSDVCEHGFPICYDSIDIQRAIKEIKTLI
jgi:ADP-heptose:LPS heptosyltransferase